MIFIPIFSNNIAVFYTDIFQQLGHFISTFFNFLKALRQPKRFITYALLQPLDIPLSFTGLVIVSIANRFIISPLYGKNQNYWIKYQKEAITSLFNLWLVSH